MSERNQSGLSLQLLKQRYQEQLSALQSALLQGALWHEVLDQRIEVTRLSQELHRRSQDLRHPAGDAGRQSMPGNDRSRTNPQP